MLTENDRTFIRENHSRMTVYSMAKRLDTSENTIKYFMKKTGLTPFNIKAYKAAVSAYVCKPPESCFNCPFNDCIRDVSKAKPSQKEVDFRFIGNIDTVGRGNDRRRV